MHAVLLVLMKPLILGAFALLVGALVAGVNRLIPDGPLKRRLNRPL